MPHGDLKDPMCPTEIPNNPMCPKDSPGMAPTETSWTLWTTETSVNPCTPKASQGICEPHSQAQIWVPLARLPTSSTGKAPKSCLQCPVLPCSSAATLTVGPHHVLGAACGHSTVGKPGTSICGFCPQLSGLPQALPGGGGQRAQEWGV